jgi:hypothetical protein
MSDTESISIRMSADEIAWLDEIRPEGMSRSIGLLPQPGGFEGLEIDRLT